jgi:3-phosphoshikimate 1-carboxyvinyltransferase
MNLLRISPRQQFHQSIQFLPTSKSICNRALVLNALADKKAELLNLSDANDTQLMIRHIHSAENLIDIEDAGTVMRFLTAYFAVQPKETILTGTARMKERPIGILVDALKEIGASIEYLEKPGFPPLKINPFTKQKNNSVSVRGDISSQFISALMMIATQLPNGLSIQLTGNIGSIPYLQMTANLMRKFGAQVTWEENTIVVAKGLPGTTQLSMEGDWSAASYWFAFVALAKDASLTLPNLPLRSLQGDRVIVDLMETLGVSCEPRGNTILLRKKESNSFFSADFSNCPDLAQTIAVVCAAKQIDAEFTGLESLRIKETDRIAALQNELAKLGATLTETESGKWKLLAPKTLPKEIRVKTYHDHRMAMAFAPLSAIMNVLIEEPEVTKKSYPNFWKDMALLGFAMSDEKI